MENSLIRTTAVVGCLAAFAVLSQTRIGRDQIRPRSAEVIASTGTLVVCQDVRCTAYADGRFVVHRVPAPPAPGGCSTTGLAAVAVDAAGYLYICSPTAYIDRSGTNEITYPGTWVRSPTPMSAVW